MKKILLLLAGLLTTGFLNAQAPCVAAFTIAPAPTGNNLLRINMTNAATFGSFANSYSTTIINFGDASYPPVYYNNLTPSWQHVYATPGTYNVGMRVNKYDSTTNALICTDTITQSYTVGWPACGVTITKIHGLNGLVTFTANNPAGSTGITYTWNFGDGSPNAVGSTATHTYANGTYTCTLNSAIGTACTYSNAISVPVTNALISCGSLISSFTKSVVNQTAHFNASTNMSLPGIGQRFYWTYGDGNTLMTTAIYNSHAYAPGTYTVKLRTVWTDAAYNPLCSDSSTQTITVISCAGNAPTYTVSQAGNVATFTNTSPGPTPPNVASYAWNFGDGSPIVSTPNPVHTYPIAGGTFTSSLTSVFYNSASGNYCADTLYQAITIAPPPPPSCASLQASFLTSQHNDQVSFWSTMPSVPSLTPVCWWDFGDGSPQSLGLGATHQYTTAGTYTAKLIVTWLLNSTSAVYCKDSITKNITADCSSNNASFTTSVAGNVATFTNTSSAALSPYTATYFWDFGDGSPIVSSVNATHSYITPTTYSVVLVSRWVDSNRVCYDSSNVSVTVGAAPVAVGGYIVRPGTASSSTDSFKVWLIKLDTATNVLSAIDSTTVNAGTAIGSWWSTPFMFTNKPAGTYRVKAAHTTAPVGVFGMVPTYADSTLYWNSALTINAFTPGSTAYTVVSMRFGTTTAGPGFIGGNVSLGTNKGTTGGVPNMSIFLRNNSNDLVKMVYTDANGDYSFNNLPVGNYNVYPENMGYATTVYQASVTTAQPAVSGANFNQDNAQMNIKPRTTSSVPTIGKDAFNIYPNPVKNKVVIAWKLAPDANARMTITNITGQIVLATDIALVTNAEQAVDVSQLQSGMYFLKLHSASGEFARKISIQH